MKYDQGELLMDTSKFASAGGCLFGLMMVGANLWWTWYSFMRFFWNSDSSWGFIAWLFFWEPLGAALISGAFTLLLMPLMVAAEKPA